MPSDQNLNQYLPIQDPKQYPGGQNVRPYPQGQNPRKYPPRKDLNQNPSWQAPAPGQYQAQPNTNMDLEWQNQYLPGPVSNIQANNMKESAGGKTGNQYPDSPPLPKADGSNFYPPLKSNPYPSRQNPQNPPMPPRVPLQNKLNTNADQNMNPQKHFLSKDSSNDVPLDVKPKANQIFGETAPGPNLGPLDQASQSVNVPFGAKEQMPVVDPIQIDQANIVRPLEGQMPQVDPIQSDQANNIAPNPVQVDKPDFDTDKKSRILGKISPKSNPPNSQNNVNPNGT